MPTKNGNLTEHYSEFVEHLVHTGRFKNAREVFRAGLRLLEQSTTEDQEKIKLLRKLVAEGFSQIDQGEGVEFENRQQLSSHVAKLGRRASKGTKS